MHTVNRPAPTPASIPTTSIQADPFGLWDTLMEILASLSWNAA
ncbi:MAG: hypothetical protein AB8I69_18925 [Anaerolineae bacterium]